MSKVISHRRAKWLWFPMRFTTYDIVEKDDGLELVITEGFFSRHVNKIKFSCIRDVSTSRGFFQFFLRQGKIILSTTDPSGVSNSFGISHVELNHVGGGYLKFAEELEELAKEARAVSRR